MKIHVREQMKNRMQTMRLIHASASAMRNFWALPTFRAIRGRCRTDSIIAACAPRR